MPAQFCHGHLEGDARPGGGFLEDHCQRSILEQFGRAALLVGGLDAAGQLDDIEQLFLCEVLGVDKVTGHGRSSLGIGGARHALPGRVQEI
jgi:hypothetical protein